MAKAPESAFRRSPARTLFASVALGALVVAGTVTQGAAQANASGAVSAGVPATAPSNAPSSAPANPTTTAPGNMPAHPQGPPSLANLAAGLLDAVVNISTSQTVKDKSGADDDSDGDGPVPMPKAPEGSPFQEFFKDYFNNKSGKKDDDSHQVQSLGSGFVIDADKGFIVTNNHVIADADDIEVNFNDGAKLKAQLVGKDTKTDLAVLKVDPSKHKLHAVQFGDSDAARIGDWVLAIGNPFGLGGTVTAGIVSARKRDINSGPYDNFIQTDAAINRGNSGGPLFDMNGKVIGINTAIISPSGGSIGIGFAIPSEMAVGVIDQLKQYGEVRRGWLGVRIQPVTQDVADSLGLKQAKGALIAGLIDNSGVDNKALHGGDVVIRFDGKPVDSARDLPRLVAESPVGKDVEIVVLRNGEEKTVKVKLGRLAEDDKSAAKTDGSGDEDQAPDDDSGVTPKGKDGPQKQAPKSEAGQAVLGMRLGVLDDNTRTKFGIADDVKGVVILDVVPGSAADEKRVTAGDVIVDIGQVTVKTPADVRKRIDGLRREGRKNGLFMLASRSGELRFVTVRLD
ncbi:MAG: Do family serine endopeptidase [Rhizobiales bacterium]|nr:Do family serine endopeptidase [Hyphomicrobiales bacterium]OJY06273.1 MAG: serine protease [Rhizobiales bacterium 63-22]